MFYLQNERVLIIGYKVKDLKSLKSLISISALVKLVWLMSTIGQIVTIARQNNLSDKDIQQLHSVKYYSRVLAIDKDLQKLSFIQAIGSVLPIYKLLLANSHCEEERIFILHEKILDVLSRISSISYLLKDSNFFIDKQSFESHLVGLALQVRNRTQAFPIYRTSNLVFKVDLLEVDLELILDSVIFFVQRLGVTNFYSRFYMELVLSDLISSRRLLDTKLVTKEILLSCIPLLIKDLLLNFDSSQKLINLKFYDLFCFENGEELVLLEQLVNKKLFFIERSSIVKNIKSQI